MWGFLRAGSIAIAELPLHALTAAEPLLKAMREVRLHVAKVGTYSQPYLIGEFRLF